MKAILPGLFLILIHLNNCANQGMKQLNTIGESFEIKLGENTELDEGNLQIQFKDVLDSRCPKNSQCIVAGEAILQMEVTQSGIKNNIELKSKGLCFESDGSCGSIKQMDHYSIRLLELKPYPIKKMPSKNKYKAVLVVNKN